MIAGPVRRFVGALGLVGLAPTAMMLVSGSLDASQAAVRAGATLVLALLVGRVLTVLLVQAARRDRRRSAR